MMTVYDKEIKDEHLISYLNRLKGKVFKIIPMRENYDPNLSKYVDSLIEELLGMDSLLESPINQDLIYNLRCILELGAFKSIRRKTFECLDIIEKSIKLLER